MDLPSLLWMGEVQEKNGIKTNILDEGGHIVDDMIESVSASFEKKML